MFYQFHEIVHTYVPGGRCASLIIIITYLLTLSIFNFVISVHIILQLVIFGGLKENENDAFHSGYCPPSVSTLVEKIGFDFFDIMLLSLISYIKY